MSRLVPLFMSLALALSLSGCNLDDLLLPEPEAERVFMVTTGRLDILADTITITPDQTIRLNRHQYALSYWIPEDKTQPPIEVDENGIVLAHYFERVPGIFECVRGEPTGRQKYLWQTIRNCEHFSSEDEILLLTPELLPVAKRIFPCAEEVNPENISQQGGFRECATAAYRRVDKGPGLESPKGRNPHCTKVGCLMVTPGFCGWTWATYVKMDGWKLPWPEPFAGTARIEIDVVC